MKAGRIFILLMVLGVLFAVVAAAPFFEVVDNACLTVGCSFDGTPPDCRPNRAGAVSVLRGVRSVCALTPTGYRWVPY